MASKFARFEFQKEEVSSLDFRQFLILGLFHTFQTLEWNYFALAKPALRKRMDVSPKTSNK